MKILSLVVIGLTLSGCGVLKPLNSHYDCPAPKGVRCTPLRQIDAEITKRTQVHDTPWAGHSTISPPQWTIEHVEGQESEVKHA